MKLDTDKIDETALALLSLTLHNHRSVWKGLDWAITDRLHEKGLIEDPVNKLKSLVLTDAGLGLAQEKLIALFGVPESSAEPKT